MTPRVTPIADPDHDASSAGRRSLCPLCESDELEYEFSVDHSPVSGCRKCGLLFLNPTPAEIPERGPFRDVYEVNVANAACRLNWLEKYLDASPGRLLLVGADATMVEDASKRGFDVFELSIDELERGSVAAAEIGRVQAVVLCCALETATDPASVLATVRRLLEPGGALMVVAPTIDSRTARLFRTNWWEFSRRNRFYFSVDTLQCLLARMQFDQPIILREDSMVSIRYVREKLASLKAFRFAVLRVFLSLSPDF
jgi:SAM-dependent methyltransferase